MAVKAMILAAGLGTRLLPLTINAPKALVTVNGITLLELAVNKLLSAGISEIIVNVHHHSSKVIDFLEKHPFPGAEIAISDESGGLLDTGGAILKARWFLEGNEPFIVHNVDVISDINLNSMLIEHIKKGGMATLSVAERQTKRYFLFDPGMKLAGWTDTSKDIVRWTEKPVEGANPLAFNGIHILNPDIFRLITERESFSVVDTYLRLAGTENIFGYLQENNTWFDAGKPDQLEKVSAYLKDHPEFYSKT
jgi:NDP-sugar pyrophosphorylase family protein